MAVGDEAGDEIDEEVDRAAMPSVLDLADVFQLIVDGLDDRPLAQEQLVRHGQQTVAHVLAERGDETQSLAHEEFFGERLGDVPTVAESGFADFELVTWTGLLAPARTPAPIVAKINQAVGALLKEPDTKEKWTGIGVQPVVTTPEQFQKIIADEVVKFTEAARKADIVVK